ncbi:P-loop nucleotide (UMP) kinase [Cryptosporidium canis]|uniref:P-loop nucleotide (UMP) kinase n=1 Tax=Cryptosporidium canis TaxID=195482 RepID=A0ABQ8P4X9_9CRYT|nr:P-loop nucleotide (UMP) kinase [Cryptosporidium canis]
MAIRIMEYNWLWSFGISGRSHLIELLDTALAVDWVQMSQKLPSVIFCLGPPGSGKGTQCAKIVKEFSFIHLSAGDCLREAMERKDETSELIDSYIREGQIVPVEVTVGLLKKKMQEHGWNDKYFLIDGFPRNRDNLEGWYRIVSDAEVNVIGCLFLDCNDEIVMDRLLRRGETSGRADDNKETIIKRLKVYHQDTIPIIEHFEGLNKCFTVDAARPIDSVWEDLEKLFRERIVPN